MLTSAQEKCFDFICEFWEENTYSPSISDIAKGLEVNPNAAAEHVAVLKRKGYVMKQEKAARTITPIHIHRHIRKFYR
jgi:SOS-response transcriptional repressor LexA